MSTPKRKFARGEYVTKTKGSSWTGRIVGTYSTTLTPLGYCVESVNEPGSVQIYPEAALTLVAPCFKCGKYAVRKVENQTHLFGASFSVYTCRACGYTFNVEEQPEQLCLNPKT